MEEGRNNRKRRMDTIRNLNESWTSFSENLTGLKVLGINALNLDEEKFKTLISRCSNLRMLALINVRTMTKASINYLASKIQNLKGIFIQNCKSGDSVLERICKSNKSLQHAFI